MSAQAASPLAPPPTRHTQPQPKPPSRRRTSSSTPSTSPSPVSTPPPNSSTQPPGGANRWTLYDAIAGRLTSHNTSLLAPSSSRPSAPLRDRLSRSTRPLRPQDALFKSEGAPQRFEERDIYDVVGGLPAGARGEERLRRGVLEEGKMRWIVKDGEEGEDGQREGVEDRETRRLTKLPDSDLLKAIHAYTSDFYGAMRMAAHDSRKRSDRRKRNHSSSYMRGSDFGSLDETALLAFGVLMEESVEVALGETGDMVFVEGEIAEGGEEEDGRSMSRSVTVDAGGEESEDGEEVGEGSGQGDGGVGKMTKKQRERMETLKRMSERDEGEDEDDDGRSNKRSRKRTKRVHYEGDEDY